MPKPELKVIPGAGPSPIRERAGDPDFTRQDWTSRLCACPEVSSAEFRVGAALVSFADGTSPAGTPEGANCFPTHTSLAARSGLSLRFVRRLLLRLEDKGWIRRIPFQTNTGRRTSDLYQFLVPARHGGPTTGPLWWRKREGRGSPALPGHPLWG